MTWYLELTFFLEEDAREEFSLETWIKLDILQVNNKNDT